MPLNGRIIEKTLIALIPLVSFATSASMAADTEGQPALVKTSTSAASRPIFQADVPPVRRLVEHALSGAEPDPESFDLVELEQWWQRYQRAVELSNDLQTVGSLSQARAADK
jgi:hypothetical protein